MRGPIRDGLSAGSVPFGVADQLSNQLTYILAQSGVPVILPSSGSSNATGLITFTTGLSYSLVDGQPCAVYLPASVTGTAGIYKATGKGTSNSVQLVGSPATANAAYTQDTTPVTLASVMVPGGSMGANGSLREQPYWTFPNNANSKTFRHVMGGVQLDSTSRTTQATEGAQIQLTNRGVQNIQHFRFGSSYAVQKTVNTAVDSLYEIQALLANPADFMVLESYTIEILPGA